MTIEQIIKTLNEFVPFSEDDILNDNETSLSELMDCWTEAQDKEKAVAAIFQLMEKYPHADFGSPGPLVHSLEACGASMYEGELHKSLMRKPTSLTLWMYNRIINAENDSRIVKGHTERLKLFSKHPLVDAETKETAENFIKHQEGRLS
jgi:hypothetical protein